VDEFEAYYWNIDDLDPADAKDARVLIDSRQLDDVLAAFERLLASENAAARGVARSLLSCRGEGKVRAIRRARLATC